MERARRAEITIAGHKVEVFQLPGSEYVMSQTQATKVINKSASSIFTFLKPGRNKSLPSMHSAIFTVPVEGSNKPIQAIPLSVVSMYWTFQAGSGNKLAQALTYACMQETLERRADAAFDAIFRCYAYGVTYG